MALRDVMNHVVEVETENAKRPPAARARGRSALLGLLCAALVAASAYSWFARPEFIWGPRRHEDTPQRAAASTRTELFLISRRIEAYRRANGRYPDALAALGSAVAGAGVTYTLAGDSIYRLTARGAGGEVSYQSDQPADAFIGNSMRVLGGTRLQP
jgi:hypothetical protein